MSLGSARLWNRRKAGVSYKLLFLRPLMLLLFKAFSCFLTKAGQRKILARDMWAYLHSDSCSIKSCDFFHGKVAGGAIQLTYSDVSDEQRGLDVWKRLWKGDVWEPLYKYFGGIFHDPQVYYDHRGQQQQQKKKSVSPHLIFFFLPVLLPTVHFLWVYTVFSFYLLV